MKKILIPLITLSMIANIYAVSSYGHDDPVYNNSNPNTGIIKQGRDVMTNNNGTNTVKKIVKKTTSNSNMMDADEMVSSPINPSTGIIKRNRGGEVKMNLASDTEHVIMPLYRGHDDPNMPVDSRNKLVSRPMCAPLEKDLSMGDSKRNGKEIAILNIQKGLIEGGYLKGTSTGYFGMNTREAIKKYQKDLGLPATGFVGKMTREKMMDACKGLPSASTTPPMPTAM